MDPRKVTAILDWNCPGSVKALQRFLGVANYYRRFIKDFSKCVNPLTALLKKEAKYVWSAQTQEAFLELKRLFTTAPVLVPPNDEVAFIVETDASDVAVGAVLIQEWSEDGQEHPVAFYSRTLLPAERNYSTIEKELLAVRCALNEWRHHLLGARFRFLVRTDHKNLTVLRNLDCRNSRQARWAFYFSQYDFDITYIPGSSNVVADALSRAYSEEEIREESFGRMFSTETRFISNLLHDVKWEENLRNISLAEANQYLTLPGYRLKEGLLCYNQRIVLLKEKDQVQILKICHDGPSAGHRGVRTTLELITRHFWWKGMTKMCKEYVLACPICAQGKERVGRPLGPLLPLPVPTVPWQVVSMDFVVELPSSEEQTVIFTVVDSFSKMTHFVPLKRLPTAKQLADIFLRDIYRLHGLPERVISDRGAQFISRFWGALCELLKIKRVLTSGYHPQANGQTERVHRTLKTFLRMFVNEAQDDWVRFLPLAEFSINNAVHSATGVSPFYAITGAHPQDIMVRSQGTAIPAADEHVNRLKEIHEKVVQRQTKFKEEMKRKADKGRAPVPTLQVGERVWLSSEHLPLQCPKKFRARYVGPFAIVQQINEVSFQLQLPARWKVHSVFHVSLLKPVKSDRFNRQGSPPPAVFRAGFEEYEVEKVLDSRLVRGSLQYLLHWKGYGVADRSWESAKEVHAARLVQLFHRRHPAKPGPLVGGHTVALRRYPRRVLVRHSAR